MDDCKVASSAALSTYGDEVPALIMLDRELLDGDYEGDIGTLLTVVMSTVPKSNPDNSELSSIPSQI